jgi:hypothetical protein
MSAASGFFFDFITHLAQVLSTQVVPRCSRAIESSRLENAGLDQT